MTCVSVISTSTYLVSVGTLSAMGAPGDADLASLQGLLELLKGYGLLERASAIRAGGIDVRLVPSPPLDTTPGAAQLTDPQDIEEEVQRRVNAGLEAAVANELARQFGAS